MTETRRTESRKDALTLADQIAELGLCHFCDYDGGRPSDDADRGLIIAALRAFAVSETAAPRMAGGFREDREKCVAGNAAIVQRIPPIRKLEGNRHPTPETRMDQKLRAQGVKARPRILPTEEEMSAPSHELPPADPEQARLVEDAMRWRQYQLERASLPSSIAATGLATQIEKVADAIYNQNAPRSRQLSEIASRVAKVELAAISATLPNRDAILEEAAVLIEKERELYSDPLSRGTCISLATCIRNLKGKSLREKLETAAAVSDLKAHLRNSDGRAKGE